MRRNTSSGFGNCSTGSGGAVFFVGETMIEDQLQKITFEMTEAGVMAFGLCQSVAPPAVLVDQIFSAMRRAQCKSK